MVMIGFVKGFSGLFVLVIFLFVFGIGYCSFGVFFFGCFSIMFRVFIGCCVGFVTCFDSEKKLEEEC